MNEMQMQQQQQGSNQIMMQNPGETPRALSSQEIIQLIQSQQQQIQMLTQKNAELEKTIQQMKW